MHNEASSTFRALDMEADWPFFDRDFALPIEARGQVHPLNESSAEALWKQQVSSFPLERHVMRLPDNHWLKPDRLGPNWLSEWNSGTGSEVSSFLESHFAIPSAEPVFFMLMREQAYQASIEFLFKHWRTFLALDDEGPVVLHISSGLYALFGPNGYLSAGLRRQP